MCDWSEVLFEEDRRRPHNHLSWDAGRSLISAFYPGVTFIQRDFYQTAKFLIFSHRKGWTLKEMQLCLQVLASFTRGFTLIICMLSYTERKAAKIAENFLSVWKYTLKFI